MTRRERNLVTPFWVCLATETSLWPGWLLIAFPAVLYPIYLALEALFGRGVAAATDFAGDYEARILPFWATALGYIAMMGTYVARGTFRDLEALRPVLRGGETAYADLRRRPTQFERRRLWIVALVWAALFFLASELVVERWTRLLAGERSLSVTCIAAAGFAVYIVFGRVAMYLIDSAWLYSRIGEQHVTVDLLDPGPLSPLTHHGLRIVLFVVSIATAAVIFFTIRAPSAISVIVPFVLASCCVVVAAAAFVLPVRGLRRQIRARKIGELTRVREEIRLDRDLVARRRPDSAEAGARLPGLLAYSKSIESVREWPFDAPTLTRFFLYVAIPLGS